MAIAEETEEFSAVEGEQDARIEQAPSANVDLYWEQIQKAAGTCIRLTTSNTLEEQHQNVRECFLPNEPVVDVDAVEKPHYINSKHSHLRITLELLLVLKSETFGKQYMRPDPSWTDEKSPCGKDDDTWDIWHLIKGPYDSKQTPDQEENSDIPGPDALEKHESKPQQNGVSEPAASGRTLEKDVKLAETDTEHVGNGQSPSVQEHEALENDKSDFKGENAEAQDTKSAKTSQDYNEDSDDEYVEGPQPNVDEIDESSDSKPQSRRYEIWNWFRHLKSAEKAAGPDSPGTRELWESVWIELQKFMLHPLRFRSWMKAIVDTTGSGTGLWFVDSGADEDSGATPFHIVACLGLTWTAQRMSNEGADFHILDRYSSLDRHHRLSSAAAAAAAAALVHMLP